MRKNIGIVFQEPSLDDLLTAKENLYLHSMLYNMPKDLAKKGIKDILLTVNLYDRKDHTVKTFSGGMKRRLEIARGLLHTPKILFLDEPTVALSVKEVRKVLQFVDKIRISGRSCVYISHNIGHVYDIADRFVIIDRGMVVANFSKKDGILWKGCISKGRKKRGSYCQIGSRF